MMPSSINFEELSQLTILQSGQMTQYTIGNTTPKMSIQLLIINGGQAMDHTPCLSKPYNSMKKTFCNNQD